jgi:hypothetical protein
VVYSINGWWVFTGICVIYLFFNWWLQTQVFTDQVYYYSLGGRVSAEKLAAFLDAQHRMSFLSYVLVPVTLVIRMTLIAFCLLTGLLLTSQKLSFKAIFRIVLFAESAFAAGVLLKLLLLAFSKDIESFTQFETFAPLSLYSLQAPHPSLPGCHTRCKRLIFSRRLTVFYWPPACVIFFTTLLKHDRHDCGVACLTVQVLVLLGPWDSCSIIHGFEGSIILGQRSVMLAHAQNESNYVDTIRGIYTVKVMNRESLFSGIAASFFYHYKHR